MIQRDSGTERLRIQRNYRDSQETYGTQEFRPLERHVGTLQEAARKAINDVSRGDPLFKLARSIKTFEKAASRKLSEADLFTAFQGWWNMPGARNGLEASLSMDEQFIFFMEALQQVRTPLGENVIEQAIRNIDSKSLPIEAQGYESPRLKRLVHLCKELQLLNGTDPFFLSVRDAAKAIGCSPIHASVFLRSFVREGLLRIASEGNKASRKATRYQFNFHQ